jgi:glutamate--cysteine ligase
VPTQRRVLTRDEARRVAAAACLAPADRPLVGLELEFLSFAGRHRPALGALSAISESPLPSGGRVTCEPGGQLESSSAPSPSVDEAIALATADTAELHARAASAGIELRAVGADRWRKPRRVVDSCRYRVMEAHFDRLGPDGRRMMCNTASLQINVGAGARPDAQWRTAHAIAPAMMAAFANSPDDRGCKSTRMRTWLAMEPTRVAPVGDPLPDAWADYALAAPALVGRADDGECVPLPVAMPFGAWIDRGSDVGYPTVEDLQYHLTMLFPPVRPRGWFEIRYLDALPSPWWEVATRVVTSLISDAAADDACAAVAGSEGLWLEAAERGLDDDRLAAAADRCFALALAVSADDDVAEYADRYVARRIPAWA